MFFSYVPFGFSCSLPLVNSFFPAHWWRLYSLDFISLGIFAFNRKLILSSMLFLKKITISVVAGDVCCCLAPTPWLFAVGHVSSGLNRLRNVRNTKRREKGKLIYRFIAWNIRPTFIWTITSGHICMSIACAQCFLVAIRTKCVYGFVRVVQ